eukprot:s1055_g24.t1
MGEAGRRRKKEEKGRRRKKKEEEGRRKEKKEEERRRRKKKEEEGRRRKKQEEEGRGRKKKEDTLPATTWTSDLRLEFWLQKSSLRYLRSDLKLTLATNRSVLLKLDTPTVLILICIDFQHHQAMKKKKTSKSPVVKAGVLAGKVKDLLPEALDLSSLKPEEDDDGPPEELTTETAAAVEEVDALLATKEKVKKAKPKKGDAPKSKAVKYLWEEPENQELLELLRQETETKRQAKATRARVEKDGVVLIKHGADEDDLEASNFLKEELFSRRKRKRSVRDRFDRNVLSAFSRARPLHVVNPRKKTRQAAAETALGK